MAGKGDGSVKVDANIRITGVTVARETKIPSLKLTVDKEYFKKQVESAFETARKKFEKTGIAVSLKADASSVKSLRDSISEQLSKVSIKLSLGVNASEVTKLRSSIAEKLIEKPVRVTLDVNKQEIDRLRSTINKGLGKLSVKFAADATGGSSGKGGKGGSGGKGQVNPLLSGKGDLSNALKAKELDQEIQKLANGINDNLMKALTGTGQESAKARDKILALLESTSQLKDILQSKQVSGGVVLATTAIKDARDKTNELNKEAQKMDSTLRKNLQDINKEGKSAGLTLRQALTYLQGIRGVGRSQLLEQLKNASSGKLATGALRDLAAQLKKTQSEFSAQGKKLDSTLRKNLEDVGKEGKRLGLTLRQTLTVLQKIRGVGRSELLKQLQNASSGKAASSFLRDYADQLKKAQTEQFKLNRLISEVSSKALVFRLAAGFINAFTNGIRGGISFLVDYESALREINKIQQNSIDGFEKTGDQILTLARNTGVAALDIAGIVEEVSRAGISTERYGSQLQITENILRGVQGTTLDTTQATEIYIQTIGQIEGELGQFNKSLLENARIFDILGKVEDITASKASDVAQAFKRSGASLVATGADFEQIASIIAVTQERTRRGAEVIGTALKTIATRISNPASEASKALRSIGVETTDTAGNLRNIFDIIQDTESAFKGLTDAEKANLSAVVAGVRQVEIFRNIISSAGRQLDVYSQALESSGDAARKQAEEQRKISVQFAQLQAKVQSIANNIRQLGFDKVILLLTHIGSLAADLVNGIAVYLTRFSALIAGGFLGLLARAIASTIKKLSVGFATFFRVTLSNQQLMTDAINQSVVAMQKLNAAGQQNVAISNQQAQAQRTAASAVGARIAGNASMAANGAPSQQTIGGSIGSPNKARAAFTVGLAGIGLLTDGVLHLSGAADTSAGKILSGTAAMTGMGAMIAGPWGAAIGGAIGLISSFISTTNDYTVSINEADKTLVGIAARHGELNKVLADQGSVDRFISGIKQAQEAFDQFAEKLLQAGDSDIDEAVSKIAEKVRAGAVKTIDPATVGRNQNQRALSVSSQISQIIGEQFKIPNLDLTRLSEIKDTGIRDKIRELLIKSISDLRQITQDQAAALLDENITKFRVKRVGNLNTALVQTESELISAENELNLFNGILLEFGTASGGASSQALRLRQELDAQSAAMADSSADLAGGFGLVVESMLQTQREAEKVATSSRTANTSRAKLFEVFNLESSFGELSRVLNSNDKQASSMAESFRNLNGIIGLSPFSDFVNKLRTGFASLRDAGLSLDESRAKLMASTKESAQVEAQLANERVRVMRESGDMRSTSDIVSFISEAQESLRSLGLTGDQDGAKILSASDKVFMALTNLRDGTAGASDTIENIAGVLQNLTSSLKNTESEAATGTVEKLLGVANKFIAEEAQQQELLISARRANINATKEVIDNIGDETSSRMNLLSLQQLSNDLITSQLTGLDQYNAELSVLNSMSSERVSILGEELSQLQKLSSATSDAGQLEVINERIVKVNEDLQKEILKTEQDAASLRVRVLDESLKKIGTDSKFESSLRDRFRRLNDVFSGDSGSSSGFSNVAEDLRANLARIGQSIQLVNSSSLPLVEKQKRIVELRREETLATLDAAVAEAELLKSRQDQLTALSNSAVENKQAIEGAKQAVIESNKAIGDAFRQYAQAVGDVISATVNYRKQLTLSSIEADNIRGKFGSINDRLKATVDVFRDAERAALEAGAGEKLIADLRKESIKEQISLLNELLNNQKREAESFFTSSRSSQADLFQGVQAISSLVESGAFQGGDINALGNQLLGLPEQLRSNIDQALSTLQNLGVGVGGMTADDIRNRINEAVLGTSSELGIDPLTEVQERIAVLTEEQASLQLEAIVAANEQVRLAKEQLAETRASRELAKIQLDRLGEEGMRIAGSIAELSSKIETVSLGRVSASSTGNIQNRSEMYRRSFEAGSQNLAATRGAAGAASLALSNTTTSLDVANRGSNISRDGSQQTTNDLLNDLRSAIVDGFSIINDSLDQVVINTTSTATGATVATGGQTSPIEFTVNVTGEQIVRVTGIAEGTQQIVDSIIQTFGPFVTEDEVRVQFIQPIFDQINTFLQARGLPPLEFQ